MQMWRDAVWLVAIELRSYNLHLSSDLNKIMIKILARSNNKILHNQILARYWLDSGKILARFRQDVR